MRICEICNHVIGDVPCYVKDETKVTLGRTRGPYETYACTDCIKWAKVEIKKLGLAS